MIHTKISFDQLSCKKRRLERIEKLKFKRRKYNLTETSSNSSIDSNSVSSIHSQPHFFSKVELRKKKNREAAERSRLKKVHLINCLTFQIYDLYVLYCDLKDENNNLCSLNTFEINSCHHSIISDNISELSFDNYDDQDIFISASPSFLAEQTFNKETFKYHYLTSTLVNNDIKQQQQNYNIISNHTSECYDYLSSDDSIQSSLTSDNSTIKSNVESILNFNEDELNEFLNELNSDDDFN